MEIAFKKWFCTAQDLKTSLNFKQTLYYLDGKYIRCIFYWEKTKKYYKTTVTNDFINRKLEELPEWLKCDFSMLYNRSEADLFKMAHIIKLEHLSIYYKPEDLFEINENNVGIGMTINEIYDYLGIRE